MKSLAETLSSVFSGMIEPLFLILAIVVIGVISALVCRVVLRRMHPERYDDTDGAVVPDKSVTVCRQVHQRNLSYSVTSHSEHNSRDYVVSDPTSYVVHCDSHVDAGGGCDVSGCDAGSSPP